MPTASATKVTILAPRSVEDTSIRRNLLEDLALKIVYLEGEITLRDLAERMRLDLAIVEELFQRLRKEHLFEVKGMTGSVYRLASTSQGRARAVDLLSMNQYSGPAPVSLQDYIARVHEQSVKDVEIRAGDVQRAFESLVLTDDTLKQLGIAVLSGTSIVLHGPTGTGKTTIAENIPRMYLDSVWIPYAVEVDGQIITVYDLVNHKRIDQPPPEESDRRWVLCQRPRIMVGGELTIEMLDLQINPVTKFYSAPLQMKANNGVLIVDDFGRQRILPEQLLNRWIVPLDRRIDSLSLAGGKKFEIPFDLLVVFATNLDLAKLADEAFLRRIPNKIKISNVSREQFHEIFRGVCGQFGLAYDAAVVDHIIDLIRTELNHPLRPCYPRDIVQQICWEARFAGKPPVLHWATVTRACHSYFLSP